GVIFLRTGPDVRKMVSGLVTLRGPGVVDTRCGKMGADETLKRSQVFILLLARFVWLPDHNETVTLRRAPGADRVSPRLVGSPVDTIGYRFLHPRHHRIFAMRSHCRVHRVAALGRGGRLDHMPRGHS